MSHLLPSEDWRRTTAPRALGYFCSVLAGGRPARTRPRRTRERVPRRPGAALVARLLARAGGGALRPGQRRAVRALRPVAPGHGRLRLPANESGYANLFLAGDWIDCGLDAGCVEAAVLAGLEAANAVRGRPLMDGILGSWVGP